MNRLQFLHGGFIALIILLSLSNNLFSQTPVSEHGLLRTEGNKIINKKDEPAFFAGHSLFWSNTSWGGDAFYNADAVSYIANEWNTPLIRASMGVEAENGYLSDSAHQTELIYTVIDAAIEEGIYVLVDWHTHHAEDYETEAIAFFDLLSETYGEHENIIYEIYNEPLQVSWSNVIKPYAEAVISTIRKNDPDNMVVVGTPNWSQYVDEAAADPISDTNVAYAFHFYAATHGSGLRSRTTQALNDGLPLFFTEWGSCESSGDGRIDYNSTRQWMQYCANYKISHVNWSLNDKAETASVLKPGSSKTGGWKESDLTESGIIARQIIEHFPDVPPILDPAASDINLASSCTIYPMPFREGFTIEFTEGATPFKAELYDASGRLIATYKIAQATAKLEVSEYLQTGVYFLKLYENHKISSIKLLRE